MEFNLRFSDNFLKQYNSLTKKDPLLKQKVKKLLKIIQVNPYYPGLHTHKVNNPTWGEVLSSRVTGDIRLIWTFDNNKRLTLIVLEIGRHDEVY